jgi:hypothetical protein
MGPEGLNITGIIRHLCLTDSKTANANLEILCTGVHTLKMGRKNADPLVGLPDTHQRNYNAAETKGIQIKDLRFRKRIAHNMQHFSMYVKGFVLETVDEVYPASQGGAIPEEWIKAVEWRNVDEVDPPDEFWRTLVGDRGLYGRNPPVYYARACKESFIKGGLQSGSVSTSDLINNERCSVVAQFCRRVQAVIWNRSLIKTSSGNIGLASKNVVKGDLACIFYGCSVPVILRRCITKKDPQQLKQEREEDFLNTLVDIQKRWKAKYTRYRRPRVQRALRVAIKLWSKSARERKEAAEGREPATNINGQAGEVDAFLDYHLGLKYGRRWKNIVKAKKRFRHDGWKKGQDKVSSIDIDPFMVLESKPILSRREIEEAWDKRYEAWLNEIPAEDDDPRYWYYEFLGEAYLHGMMDGEASTYTQQPLRFWKPPFCLTSNEVIHRSCSLTFDKSRTRMRRISIHNDLN